VISVWIVQWERGQEPFASFIRAERVAMALLKTGHRARVLYQQWEKVEAVA